MRDYLAEYRKWLESPHIDEATKTELKAIEGNDEEIKERFCSSSSLELQV